MLVGFVGAVYGIPEFTEAEKVYGADSIGIGQILSYHDEGEYRFYEISILKVLKNTLPDKITMRSVNELGFDPIDPHEIFRDGDVVLLYLKDYNRGFLESTNFSQLIPDGRLQNTINEISKLVNQTEKTSPEPPSESSMGQITWKEASFPGVPHSTATLIVSDPDMNKYPNTIDFVWVQVFSDSDNQGFKTTLFETGLDSGIFQADITFVDSPPSGRNFLYTVEGDTITAKYIDTNFPSNLSPKPQSTMIITKEGIELYSTALIGRSFPPLERVEVSDLKILARDDTIVKQNSVFLDQQIQVISDLKNPYNGTQPFVYLVQILNQQNQVESLSWITGNLTSYQEISPALSWIPIKEGVYEVTVFVWESLTNPTALAPPLSTELEVM